MAAAALLRRMIFDPYASSASRVAAAKTLLHAELQLSQTKNEAAFKSSEILIARINAAREGVARRNAEREKALAQGLKPPL